MDQVAGKVREFFVLDETTHESEGVEVRQVSLRELD